MTFASAYLIRQVATWEDPLHPPQDEETKSWFKKILKDYPTRFPEYMGIEMTISSDGELVTAVKNYDYRYEPALRDDIECKITSIDDFEAHPGYWVYKDHGNYISPGMNITFPNTYYYSMMEGSQKVGRYAHVKKSVNGTITELNVWVSDNASAGNFYQPTPSTEYSASHCWAYAIACNIKVPVFSNAEYGAGWTEAANNYYNNPTDENYNICCNYIDLCDNPNGGN